jgi:hypothetical protein
MSIEGQMFLFALIPDIPLVTVGIGGALLVRRRLAVVHHRASLSGTLGFSCLVLYTLVGPVARTYAATYGTTPSNAVSFGSQLAFLNVLGYLLLLSTVVLLGVAALSDRALDKAANTRVPAA